jgi:hypothetical protein
LGDKLEWDKGDFKKWEQDFMLFVTLNHLDGYFFIPLTQPPHATEEPRAHSNFITNSCMAVATLQQAIGESEMEFIDYTKGAKVCYDIIMTRCRSTGPVKQISFICMKLSQCTALCLSHSYPPPQRFATQSTMLSQWETSPKIYSSILLYSTA